MIAYGTIIMHLPPSRVCAQIKKSLKDTSVKVKAVTEKLFAQYVSRILSKLTFGKVSFTYEAFDHVFSETCLGDTDSDFRLIGYFP